MNDFQEKGFVIATRPEAIRIALLNRKEKLGVGKIVYNSRNNPVILKQEVLVNADSITYTTNQDGIWAKIYAPKALTTLIEEKCKRMLGRRIRFKGICWPMDLLRDSNGVFAGVLIPEAVGIPLSQCVFKGIDNGIRKYFPGWDKRQLTQLTKTILEKIIYLHKMGILFGCLNPASILVKDENTVFFTDMDHYQIEGFPCMIRNTMFTPPELQDKLQRNKLYLCTMNHEKYAVALLVFMLMMPGKMPYSIEDSIHAPESIVQQKFAFSYKGEHGSNRTVGSWRFVWSHLTPFKELFFRTFQNGEKFNAPECRPSDRRWLAITYEFKKELDGEKLYDPHTRELVPKSFKRSQNVQFVRCRYCGVEHPIGYFRKEYFEEYRICNSCLDEPSKVSFTCVDCGRTFTYTNRTAIFHERMRKRDDGWKLQKHCKDCKSKMTRCTCCGKEVPLYQINHLNAYCHECENKRKEQERNRRNMFYRSVRCKDCKRYFTITVGEHERCVSKGHDDPIRCEACREAKRRRHY